MSRSIFQLCLLVFLGINTLTAQNLSINISTGLRKTFTLSKKSSLDLRGQIQLIPKIEAFDKQDGDFFNEESFWRIPDVQNDDSSSGSGNELNDDPYQIEFNWRYGTGLQYNYSFKKWMRSNAGYSTLYDGESFRHSFRIEADYRPMRQLFKKSKLDLAARVMYQRNGQKDDSFEWDHALIPRLDAEWTFVPNNILFVSQSVNGVIEDADLEFDRYRVSAGFKFAYQKIHRFTINYQIQYQLTGKSKIRRGISFGYEVRI